MNHLMAATCPYSRLTGQVEFHSRKRTRNSLRGTQVSTGIRPLVHDPKGPRSNPCAHVSSRNSGRRRKGLILTSAATCDGVFRLEESLRVALVPIWLSNHSIVLEALSERGACCLRAVSEILGVFWRLAYHLSLCMLLKLR